MDTSTTRRRMEPLNAEECRALLGRSGVGRLGVIRGGYPLIFPVNYAMHGDRVVIRTDSGTKLRAANYHRVSFEVDELDHEGRCGWSVLVQGFATEVTLRDPAYAAMRSLPVTPWAPGEREHVLVIAPISVTGRRISINAEGDAPTSKSGDGMP